MLMPPAQAAFMAKLPRAERETGNTLILGNLDLCQAAIQQLGREGHMVVGVKISGGRVTITIAASAKLAFMAAQGRAVYYMRGVDETGQRYRKGVLPDYRHVHVVWTERGN